MTRHTQQIETIRTQLEEQNVPYGFPRTGCAYATEFVVNQLPSMERVDGFFTSVDGQEVEHTWLRDSETDEFIDLTADQFDSSLPGVVIVPSRSYQAAFYYSRLPEPKI